MSFFLSMICLSVDDGGAKKKSDLKLQMENEIKKPTPAPPDPLKGENNAR